MNSDFKDYFRAKNIELPLVIAGPCSAESPSQLLATARGLQACGVKVFRAGVWKPRTRPGGFEGYGAEALRWLTMVKEASVMLTATEIGCAAHAELAMKAGVDILWIGARTTASPFAVQEIAETLRGCNRPVLVKNPAALDIELWIGAMERLHACGLHNIAAIHRGFKVPGMTGYRNAPLWDDVTRFRDALPEIPLICDPSHMGGSRAKILPLSIEACRRGYDGLIVECHCEPDAALTDSFQQIKPAELASVMQQVSCACAVR